MGQVKKAQEDGTFNPQCITHTEKEPTVLINGEVRYDPNEHTYTNIKTKKKLTSVTTVINDYLELKYGKGASDKANVGTRIHKEIENFVINADTKPYFLALKKLGARKDNMTNEIRLYNDDYAGTCDCVVDEEHLIHYKTGEYKEFYCKLQMGTYALLYKHRFDKDIKKCTIIQQGNIYPLDISECITLAKEMLAAFERNETYKDVMKLESNELSLRTKTVKDLIEQKKWLEKELDETEKKLGLVKDEFLKVFRANPTCKYFVSNDKSLSATYVNSYPKYSWDGDKLKKILTDEQVKDCQKVSIVKDSVKFSVDAKLKKLDDKLKVLDVTDEQDDNNIL